MGRRRGLQLLGGHFSGERWGWEQGRGVRNRPESYPCAALPGGSLPPACVLGPEQHRTGQAIAHGSASLPGWSQPCLGPWLCCSLAGSQLSALGTSVLGRCLLRKTGAFLL